MSLRVAVLGPITTAPFREHLPSLPSDAPRGTGGSNIVNLILARLVRNLATDVITVDPTATQEIQRFEGPLLRLWIVRRRSRRAFRDFFREERRLLHRAVHESGAEVCHANWTLEYGLAAVSQESIPHVVSVHDHAGNMLRHIGWRGLPHYAITRRVLARAQMLTAVSPYIADYLELLTDRKIEVVPNLLSEIVWQRAHKADGPLESGFRIASALTWSPFRNVQRALWSFKRLRVTMPDAAWTLIGPGFEQDGPAHVWARANACDGGVRFQGRMPYAQTLDIFAGSNLIFHPSLEESFGSPVAEAMALGKPVVAVREAGGPRWLLDDGRAGFLATGRDESDLAATLERACCAARNGDAALSRMLEVARHRIAKICDSEVIIQAYNAVYASASL